MPRRFDRRTVLTGLGAGLAGGFAGCSGLSLGGDGSDATGATAWPMSRGTAGNTGQSATGGPPPEATQAFTARLRDGSSVGAPPPRIGDDGIYAVATEAEPFDHDPPRSALYAYKFSREDSSEQWRRTVAIAEGAERTRDIRLRGTCLGPEAIYAVWTSQDDTGGVILTALSRDDGATKWDRVLEATQQIHEPIVRNGRLYHFAADELIAFDTADGSEVWRSPRLRVRQFSPSVGESGIAVYHRGDTETVEKQISVLDPDSGQRRWTEPFQSGVAPLPTVAGDTVYVAEGDEPFASGPEPGDRPPRKIHAVDVEDGTRRWTHTYETDAMADAYTIGGTWQVTLAGDHVYYGLGFLGARKILGVDASEEAVERIQEKLYTGPNVVALSREDGSVAWRTEVGSKPRIFQPMVAGPDNLYALYDGIPEEDEEESRVFVIDRSDGTVRGAIGPVAPSQWLAVADGSLYTRDGSAIHAWQ